MSISAPSSKPKLALIAGPTASGKSALAVELGQRLALNGKRAVVINADSAQVYADLQVLSARPLAEEMGGIEHRLFGVWDGADACSAAHWATAAKREIRALHGEGAVPILVGGTGLYLRTLIDGIAPVPVIDPEIRNEVRRMPQAEARAALEREDPATAALLAPADSARTARALEVLRSTGRRLAEWHSERIGGIAHEVDLHPLVLLPERAWLYARCERRFRAMLDNGAHDEVATLLGRGLDPALPVMRAIGVREVGAWIENRASREEAAVAGGQATRRYAKRQYTWFAHQTPDSWAVAAANGLVADALSGLLARILASGSSGNPA